MSHLELHDLSSCEGSDRYYVTMLKNAANDPDSKNIESVSLKIDEGVDFRILAGLLFSFTNLDNVKIEQARAIAHCTLTDVIDFINAMKPSKFSLVDTQSIFLSTINPHDLFKRLPSNCTYNITHGLIDNAIPLSLTTHMDVPDNKYLVFTRGSM